MPFAGFRSDTDMALVCGRVRKNRNVIMEIRSAIAGGIVLSFAGLLSSALLHACSELRHATSHSSAWTFIQFRCSARRFSGRAGKVFLPRARARARRRVAKTVKKWNAARHA